MSFLIGDSFLLLLFQFLGHLTWVTTSLNPSSRDELLQLLDTARVTMQCTSIHFGDVQLTVMSLESMKVLGIVLLPCKWNLRRYEWEL